MKQRTISENVNDKRMLGIEEAAKYIGMGKNYTRAWADEIGAVRHMGRRVLFDKLIIDQALNNKQD